MEKLANASSNDGRMLPSTSRKKDLGVVTSLVTTEREHASFFLSGASRSFCIFCIYFLFNFVLFSFYLSLLIPTTPLPTLKLS